MKSRARCSTLQFEAFFGHFIAVQSQVEWTPSKGWYSVFTATWLLKYTLIFVGCARSRRRLRLNPLNQRHHGAAGRALWRELAAHVSLLKHSRSFALKVSLLPLSVLCDARCCWWCAAACGWRLCRFILQKEKMQV